jgi:hypothetical protein
MQTEDLILLRLPPRLATRLGGYLARHQRKRAEEKRKRKRSVRNNMTTSQVQESVWIDDDVPDNSDDEHADHFYRVYESVVLDMDDDNKNKKEETDPSSQLLGNELLDIDIVAADSLDLEEQMDGSGATAAAATTTTTTTTSTSTTTSDDPTTTTAAAATAATISTKQFDFSCIKGKEYVFRFSNEEYHATLIKFPTIIEVQKTFDNKSLYKSGDIGHMLIVHDVPFSQPRPAEWDKYVNSNVDEYPHGLTPPLQNVVEERFQRFSSTSRLEHEGRNVSGGLTLDDVKNVDVLLGEFRDLVVYRDKERHRNELTKKKNRDKKDPEPIRFVYEEIVDGESWMEWYPEEVIRLEQGQDNFVKSTEDARKKALEAKRKEDEKLAEARELQARYNAAFGPSQDG